MLLNHIISFLWIASLFGFQANNTGTGIEQASYFVLPHLPVNGLTNGSILAIARKGERKFLDAKITKGSLPSGVSLFPDGTIAVIDHAQLEAGKYSLRIAIMDNEEETNIVKVKLVIEEKVASLSNDKVPFVSVLKPKNIEEYSQGEIIAKAVDPDGQITKAEVVRGKVPKGLFLTHDGKIIINNPQELSNGNHNFWLYVEDEHKGCDFIILSLTLGKDSTLTSSE